MPSAISPRPQSPAHELLHVVMLVMRTLAAEMRRVRTPVAPARSDRAAPRLGEQSAAVLADYGFSADEIADLAPRPGQ